MNDFGMDEIISKLYEMIQDAKGVPFSADKCSIDRNRALDLLDDLSNHMPGALKQAQTIMDSRAELITAAKRDAAEIRRQAQEEAQKLVSQEAVYNEARQAANDMVRAAQDKTKELIEVARSYVDDSLRKTEEAVAQALAEVRDMRNAYRAVSKPQARTESPIIEEV
jgi:ATP phosphoribosyltransferase